ncbi:MAG: cadherin domain-containing protein [Gammaproteobacteria bacterium]|nr:cadherin domain-containing protein [Gammaproteobacteria bacterium]
MNEYKLGFDSAVEVSITTLVDYSAHETVRLMSELNGELQLRKGRVYKISRYHNETNLPLDQIVAIRDGDDLKLQFSSQDQLILMDYFELSAEGQSGLELALSSNSKGDLDYFSLAADSSGLELGDGTQLLLATGDFESLIQLAVGEPLLHQAIQSAEKKSFDYGDVMAEADVEKVENEDTSSALSYLSIIPVILFGAVVAGASSGGSNSKSAAVAITEDEATVIVGEFAAGPAITDHGLKVTAYDAQGNMLGKKSDIDENGQFRIDVGIFTGTYFLEVRDESDEKDYIDEATGERINFPVDVLRSMGVATNGGESKTNVTPLTELASARLIVNGKIAADAERVMKVIKAMNELFNLDITQGEIKTTIDKEGNAQEPNAYGTALAIISKLDNLPDSGGMSGTLVIFRLGLTETEDGSFAYKDNAAGNTLKQKLESLQAELSRDKSISDVQKAEMVGQYNHLLSLKEAPTISSLESVNVNENTESLIIYTVETPTNNHVFGFQGDEEIFSFDEETGVVSLNKVADFESRTNYSFVVTVKNTEDVNAKVSAMTVTLNILDVNEATTIESDDKTSIDENIDDKTVVYTVKASDADSAATLKYSLGTSNDEANFDINADSGEVTFKDGVIPNFEGKSSYKIEVIATDNHSSVGSPSVAKQTVTLSINDANDAPSITSATTAAFDENNAARALVYTVTATDEDSAATLTYSLGESKDEVKFDIDADSGEVTTKADFIPNFEDKSSYEIEVIATDNHSSAGNPSVASQIVTLSINDVNEATTITSGTTAAFDENNAARALVYTVTATDEDSAATLKYSLGRSNDEDKFDINADSGEVTTKADFIPNFEGKSSYQIEVIATDNHSSVGNPSVARKTIDISINDVNEAPTVVSTISNQSYLVGHAITAIDLNTIFNDVDANDALTYTSDIPTNSGLSINLQGEIVGTPSIAITEQTFTITATDNAGLNTQSSFKLAVIQGNPQVSSVLHDVNNLDVRSPIVLTFTEAVSLEQTGTITLSDLNTSGKGWRSDKTDNTQTIDIGDATQVSLSADGLTLTIDPKHDLDFGTKYGITITANAFKSVSTGMTTDAVGAAEIEFTTVTPAADTVGAASQIQGADGVLSSSYVWIDTHQSVYAGETSTPISIDASNDSVALVAVMGIDARSDFSGYVNVTGYANDDLTYVDKTGNDVLDTEILPDMGYGWGGLSGSSEVNAFHIVTEVGLGDQSVIVYEGVQHLYNYEVFVSQTGSEMVIG